MFRIDKLITFLIIKLHFNRPLHISTSLPGTFEDGAASQLLEFSESLIMGPSNIVFVSEPSFKCVRLQRFSMSGTNELQY